MDLEYEIERELMRAVENKKNFHQVAGSIRSIFFNVNMSNEDQDKILNNLKALIRDYRI